MNPDWSRLQSESEARYAWLWEELGLAWEYERRTFVLKQREDGLVLKAFTPDFYLPEIDLYVEVTDAKTITKKNRKIRETIAQYGVKVLLLRHPRGMM